MVAYPCAESVDVEHQYGTATPHQHGSAVPALRLLLVWCNFNTENFKNFKFSKFSNLTNRSCTIDADTFFLSFSTAATQRTHRVCSPE